MLNAEQRISRAKKILMRDHVFFRALATRLKTVRRDSVETMATDGIHLFYCDATVQSWSDKQLIGVVAEEILHCAREHFARRNNRNLEGWNEACDYGIHSRDFLAQFRLPESALIDHRFEGLSSEQIYRIRESEQSASDPDGQTGGSGDPDGQTGSEGGRKLGCGGILDLPDDVDSEELAESWQVATRQAAAMARKDAGKLPGYLESLVDELDQSRVNWRKYLRRFVDESTTKDYSWIRPNKKHIGQPYILPGYVSDGISKLVVLLDVSGSVYNDQCLHAFRGEIEAAFSECGIDQLVVIYTDTRVTAVDRFEIGDEIKLNAKGGGGTNFREAMRYLADEESDAVAAIFLTDMETWDFGDDPGLPVLWCNYGTAEITPPFGECVFVDPFE